MNDDRLSELLDHRVADLRASPPPLDRIRADARTHVRRARLAVATVAALALVAVTAGLTLTRHDADRAVEPATTPSDTPPPGTHYVGIGRVVIAVPDGVATIVDGQDCLDPGVDSVVIGAGVGCVQRAAFPPDRDLVEVTTVPPPGAGSSYVGVGAHPVDIDGERAIRSSYGVSGLGAQRQEAVVYLPDSGVLVTVSSSKPGAGARVDGLADTITILQAHTVVPPRLSNPGLASPTGMLLGDYRALLTAAGLAGELVGKVGTGEVSSVSPAPGTIVPLGTSVELTTYAFPHG